MRGDECSKLAQSDYRKRHDEVAYCVHWNLGKKRDLPHSKNWYGHVPEKETENNMARLLWDLVQMDHVIEVRRTDIRMLDKDTGDRYHSSWRWKGQRKGNGKAREIPDRAKDIRKLWKTSVNDECGANCGWRKQYRGLI